MNEKPTTPEEVLSAIGELIVYKTEQGYNTDEMVALVAAYTKLLEAMPTDGSYVKNGVLYRPAQIIRKEEVQ